MSRIIGNRVYGTGSYNGSHNPSATDRVGSSDLPLDNVQDASVSQSTGTIKSNIINSALYQQASNLFSSLPDKSWYMRLEAIVNSVVGTSSTWWDDIGLSNQYNDKASAIEAEALNQIQKLITEYYQYKQELPITQVQDFADAGINSAITGQGIEGASISGMASEKDMSPYQMQSTNPLESISSIGNLIFSASDGILSAIQVFNQIGVNRANLKQSARSSHWSIQKDLMELGFSSFPTSSSVEDFDKWWNSTGINEAKNLNLGKSTANQLRSRLQHNLASTADNLLFDLTENGSYFLSDVGQSIVNKMVDFEISTWQKTSEYKKAYSEYMSLYQATLDPVKMANLSMDKESLQKELLSKQKYAQTLANELATGRNNAIKDWIDSAGDDAQARAIIARVLMNVSATESAQLQNFGDFAASQAINNYLSPLSTMAGMAAPLAK